jgi:Zn-dependent peptidase ImmA (M78 family)
MRPGITKAENKAISLLKELNISTIPIALEKITTFFGIKISYDLGENVSGILISKKDVTIIGVNPTESSVRQRFTIAHEIGHYCMHKNKAELFVDTDYIVMKRSGEKDNYELEANAFAAALLMPEENIEKELSKLSVNIPTDDKIKTLAKKFEVSTIAMTYRLSNLELI